MSWIQWGGAQSIVVRNPTLAPLPGEERIARLLPGHVWFMTSGSSGGPRRWVGLSQAALLESAAAVNRHLRVTKLDHWFSCLPTFHVSGFGILARAHVAGINVTQIRGLKWSVSEFASQLRSSGATLTALVPTQVFDLVAAREPAPPRLRAAVVGGGALRSELYAAARALGWPLLPSYGLTECASQVATAPLRSLTTNQFPELEILDHVECRVSAAGRLELKSMALLSAYAELGDSGEWRLRDPKSGGWFTTEDRAELRDRVLIPLGRVQEQVKVLGELVDLARLEGHVDQLIALRWGQRRGAREACLLARPQARSENQIDLVVGGMSLDEGRSLYAEFNATVSGFERAQDLYVVERLPRGSLGKIERGSLRQLLGFEKAP